MKHLCAYALLFLSIATATCLFAQSTSATISGIVTDPAGRAIPQADIVMVNDGTGLQYPSKTNGVGIYSIPILPPGRYHMQVSKVGFKTVIKPDIILNVQSALGVNFNLPVGAASETVTVQVGNSLLNTTDASVSTVIERKFVQNIPLNGRSFQDLISLTPGVLTQSPQTQYQEPGENGDFSVNGQRTESNYYTVDGVSANISAGYPSGAPQTATGGGLGASTALGTTQSLVSVDDLQEFRVESSTYSAEYGRSPGGQFAIVTRSGTNMLHGSAFDYLRNDYFDANDWFNDHYGDRISQLRQNDFGGTLGGPVVIPRVYSGIGKSFFFASYEGLRLTQPQAATIQYVPDTCMRQNAPAALQPILNAFPIQNGIDYGTCNSSETNPSFAQFIQPYSLPSKIDSTSIRVDHTFAQPLTVFFRFADTPSSSSMRSLSSLAQNKVNTRTYTLGITNQFSGRFDNEFRLGYAQAESTRASALDSFGGATPIDLASAMGISGSPNAEPVFDMSFLGLGLSGLETTRSENQGRQWNAIDTASFLAGRHRLKFGIDYRDVKSPLIPSSPYAFSLFLTPGSVLANAPLLSSILKTDTSTPIFHEFAAFVQDDWRLRPSLSLSFGLRWEVDPPPNGEHGNDAYTLSGNIDDPATIALAFKGTPLWKTTWFNFAPRLGMAWAVRNTPGWETVLRSGGGIFFDTDDELATEGFGGLGFMASNTLFGSPLPFTSAQLNFSPSTTPPYTNGVVYAFPTHLQLPYTYEWNASIQQSLDKSQALTITYVGSNGRRLLYQQELNIEPINPEFGTILFTSNGTSSNYQALQVQFQRSLPHGLNALASYTWSHSIDFGSNSAALPEIRGDSDFDVRNNLAAGLSWDLPNIRRRSSVDALLNGWGIDGRVIARTGFPVTLQGNYLTDPATGSTYYGNLDQVPNQPIYLYGSQYPGGRTINSAAFAYPAGNGAGSAPRNFVRGFGAFQINPAARREFTLRDRLALEFRAEAFNILNHPNFGYIDSYLGDATFGLATQMLNQSLGTMSSLYQQGGPRSMQFALRLHF
ncbi:MAG: carboxypeptidase regulatory-like domain-containing protein [Silvibacterium sp.]